MALYFFVLLTLLTLALCLPDPNVKVGIDVDVDVDYKGCGGGGCNKKSCSFGGVVYENGESLKACVKLLCENEKWVYTGLGMFDLECGNCIFGGEPIVFMFDNLEVPDTTPPKYTNVISVNETGDYVMTQNIVLNPPPDTNGVFGVSGQFIAGVSSAVDVGGITYYEDDNHVTLTLPPDVVNTEPETKDETLVFKLPSTFGGGKDCNIIIGSKGLTVALCTHSLYSPLPWAFIYAMPDLKSTTSQPQSQLYGICNTWTPAGKTDYFTNGNGSQVTDWQCGNGVPFPFAILCESSVKSWTWSP